MTNREFFQRIRPYDRFPSRAPRVAAVDDPRRELIRFAFLGACLLLVVLVITDRHRFDFVGQLPNGTSIVLYAPDPKRAAPAPVAPTVAASSSVQDRAYDSVMALFNRDGSAVVPMPGAKTQDSGDASSPVPHAASNIGSGMVALTDGTEGRATQSQNLVDRAVAVVGGLVDRDSLERTVRAQTAAAGDMLDDLRLITARHMTFFEDELGIDRSEGAMWLIVMAAGLLVFTLFLLIAGKMNARAYDNRFMQPRAVQYATRR
ncbi:MAG: hypothetical protein ACREQF_00560 [Candidatus Binataceae bacterium]